MRKTRNAAGFDRAALQSAHGKVDIGWAYADAGDVAALCQFEPLHYPVDGEFGLHQRVVDHLGEGFVSGER